MIVLQAILEGEETAKAGDLKGGYLMEWLLVLEGCQDRILGQSTGSSEDNGCQAGWLLGNMHLWEEAPGFLCACHFLRLV